QPADAASAVADRSLLAAGARRHGVPGERPHGARVLGASPRSRRRFAHRSAASAGRRADDVHAGRVHPAGAPCIVKKLKLVSLALLLVPTIASADRAASNGLYAEGGVGMTTFIGPGQADSKAGP